MSGPRVILGMTAYRRPDALARTIESLLSQRFGDLALVITDDAPSPETASIGAAYARLDGRVVYEANERRLGLVGNCRRSFARARELYPGAEYFAWVSDHDVWHARWLQEMVAVLDGDRDVVLAYCRSARTSPEGVRIEDKQFETRGVSDPADRLRLSARRMLAGDMVYGLVRVEALAAVGVFHHVLVPDRQMLLALSLFGQAAQVPEILWYREFVSGFSLQRQREAFFPDGAPLYSHLPWWLQHAATLFWDLSVQGRGRPVVGRVAAVRYAAIQLWSSLMRDLLAEKAPWRYAAARHALGRWLFGVPPGADRRERALPAGR